MDGKLQAEVDGKLQMEVDGKLQVEVDGKLQMEVDGKLQVEGCKCLHPHPRTTTPTTSKFRAHQM